MLINLNRPDTNTKANNKRFIIITYLIISSILTKKARMNDSNTGNGIPTPHEDDILAFIIAIKSRYRFMLLV